MKRYNYRVCDDLYNYYTNSKWLYNNPLIKLLVQDMQFATSLHQSVCNLKIESLLPPFSNSNVLIYSESVVEWFWNSYSVAWPDQSP